MEVQGMAKISLRGYKKEIENLIDRGQLEEAIAHSKYILSTYPKYIDSYRLLGKAFLEAQKYKDAGDIFQRVLSSIPDDFISHIGMSIYKEDAGDLDSAIWYMERAFETQPSNAGIQTELKRLYGRRDGVEPVKIRLTKGALVRMYARSNLYSQAIAEALSALAEDPSRMDIEITLAQMYYLSGQKLDATEISSKVVSKLPFCFEANRILAEVLTNTSRAEDAKIYRDRVISLDPYFAYVSENTPDLEAVPENAVMVEHFSWQTSAGKEKPLEWAIPSNVVEQNPLEPSSDWLSTAREELSQPENKKLEAIEQPVDEPPMEEAIPDWMKTAGWQPSDNTTEVEPQHPAEDEKAIPAEIPSWLKEIASTPISSEEENPLPPGLIIEESSLPTMDTIAPPSLEKKVEEEQTQPVEIPPSSENLADVPEWLRETVSGSVESKPPSIPEESIQETGVTEKAQEKPIQVKEPIPDTMPTWLKEIKADSELVVNPSDEIPAAPILETPEDLDIKMPWLESLGSKESLSPTTKLPETVNELPSDATSQSEPREWLEESQTPNEPQKLSVSDNLPEWLKEIEITAEGEESLKVEEALPEASSTSEIPDWLKDLKEETPPEPKLQTSLEIPQSDASTSQPNMQKWLQSLDGETSPQEATLEVPAHEPADRGESQPVESHPSTIGETSDISDLPHVAPISNDENLPPELLRAEQAFNAGELSKAAGLYKEVIKSGMLLDLTIASLQRAIVKDSKEPSIWQTLGDAFSKNNQLREALEAYNKAEELLR
jgi:tetratricopeptide (TPR) repeat protein